MKEPGFTVFINTFRSDFSLALLETIQRLIDGRVTVCVFSIPPAFIPMAPFATIHRIEA